MQHSEIIKENAGERQRLHDLVDRLTETQLGMKTANGWTVAVTLAHLAFWDLRQVTMIQRWLQGVPPGSLDYDAINGPIAILAATIPPSATPRLALDAAQAADREVEQLTPARVEELVKMGFEGNLRRGPHRRMHIEKIEATLKKGPASAQTP